MNLSIISFNCGSFNSQLYLIGELMKKCNILLLQETFLTAESSHHLNKIGPDYCFYATPAKRKDGFFAGRASGGLAIIFHKKFEFCIKPFFYSDRIMGIHFFSGNLKYFLLNVYLPCDYRDDNSLISYKSNISELS